MQFLRFKNQAQSSKYFLFFVLSAFFVSGSCGLIYEVFWTRYLADLMGATSLSHMVVLVVFMGGLAVGAALLGKYADRISNSLAFYAWLEIGIGLYGFFFPIFFHITEKIFHALAFGMAPGSLTLFFLKISFSTALIIVPSIAMGATLPAVTRYINRSGTSLRTSVGLLYGVNSLGAVVGTLFAGFYLVHRIGISNSFYITGIVNVILGLVVLLATSKFSLNDDEINENKKSNKEQQVKGNWSIGQPEVNIAIGVAFSSGLAAMALQMLWIRYFGIILGSMHTSFVVVVAAFISGISIGSFLISTRLFSRYYPPYLLIVTSSLATVIIGLSIYIYGRIPYEIGTLQSIIAKIPKAWAPFQILRFGICFVIMAIPTMMTGMILPLCIRIVAGSTRKRVGQYTGRVYAMNTIGSLIGIILVSQLLFRITSLPISFTLILLIFFLVTLITLFYLPRFKQIAFTTLALFLSIVFLFSWQQWNPLHLFTYRVQFQRMDTYQDFLLHVGKKTVVADLLDPDAQVTVYKQEKGNQSLVINGKPDASDLPADIIAQKFVSHIPMLLQENPKDVFVLGLGSGMTSGEILKYQEVENVTTAELSSAVFEASKYFSHINDRYWENPKHKLFLDDGRTVLQLSEEQYDVIVLAPTNIWQSGGAGLFSEDFIHLVKSRLAPKGIACQWLHTYSTNDLTVNIVLKTFSTAFEQTRVFQLDPTNYIILGYDNNWKFDAYQLIKRFENEPIRNTLAEIDIRSPLDLLLSEVISEKSFKEHVLASNVPVNSLDWPFLEIAAEKGFFLDNDSLLLEKLDDKLNPDLPKLSLLFQLYIEAHKISDLNLPWLMNFRNQYLRKDVRLENSFAMRLVEDYKAQRPGKNVPENIYSFIPSDFVRELVKSPTYGSVPNKDSNRLEQKLKQEIQLWKETASAFWKPDLVYLTSLAENKSYKSLVDKQLYFLDIGMQLASISACQEALPFFNFAESQLFAGSKDEVDKKVVSFFHCEAKVGSPEKAAFLWKYIEREKLKYTRIIQEDYEKLQIKRGGKGLYYYGPTREFSPVNLM